MILQMQEKSICEESQKQITINLDRDVVDYFKEQSENTGIPYQTLINLYLADCAVHQKQLQMTWK